MPRPVALITGPTSGIGAGYARRHARDGGLHGTGVGVDAVCPGFVHTEFRAWAGLDMAKLPSFLYLEVDDVVTAISVPGIRCKALVGAGRLIPRGLLRSAVKRAGGDRGRT